MTPRDHALRVAALEALTELAKKEYAKARAEAEESFKAVRADGQSQQRVLLPDGEDIGLISIRDGAKTADVTEGALMAWCREHVPDAIEEHIAPEAMTSADVIAVVWDKFPDLIRERVRPGTAAELLKEITESGGFLTDQASGERIEVAEVTKHDPTGAFAFAGGGAQQRRERIVAEWQAGRLHEIGFGPAALPAGTEGGTQ